MTDTSYPFTTIPGQDPSHPPPVSTISRNIQQQTAAPAIEKIHEDEGQISCICGFNDDDGYTVACDSCNRWQHIICYYPQHENSFPDEVQHWCVDCRPRHIDRAAAYQRQSNARDQQRDLNTNGVKRAATKTTKKKTKEQSTTAYTNGWPTDRSRHDRNSVSPRDQPPPAKKPKTSHRPSHSTANASTTGRKRNGTFSRPRSASRSPGTPQEIFSENFLRCHLEDKWSETQTNCHTNIAVSDRLSKWLQEADEDFADAHGFEKRDVFVRWDGQIEEISHASQVQLEEHMENNVAPLELGDTPVRPTWKYVTLQGPVPEGACIGELRGHVGLKEDYYNDPSNRWSLLRHPEPFVFFHPKLPIYVDARREGSLLRYVRRSCSPNARMQIMITEGTEYHFCFMAMRDIEPGEEVAIMWDSQEGLQNAIAQGNRNGTDLNTIKSWVTNVLANCGPCACNMNGAPCMMSRFDRRGLPLMDDDAPPVKIHKARKKKGQQVSPVNINAAFNSRSGSEVRKAEADDQSDSRSTSGSAGRGSASRDMTPNTHYSTNGSTVMPEMSERERKKLAKEEEMFRRQEEEASVRQKKKRGSAGSALNTPAATSTKQFNFPPPMASRYTDAATGKQSGLPTNKAIAKRTKTSGVQRTSTKSTPAVKVVRKPRPEYTDASTQCDLEEEEAFAQSSKSPSPTKRYISITQRLLERCALNNAKRKRGRSQAGSPTSRRPEVSPVDRVHDEKPLSVKLAVSEPVGQDIQVSPVAATDIDMPDIAVKPDNLPNHACMVSDPHASANSAIASSPSDEQPAQHLPESAKPTSPAVQRSSPSPSISDRPGLHIDMPPPQNNAFAMITTDTSAGPNASHSPAAMAPSATPLLSPAVTAAVNPSPARKKLSLSDYTKRSKAKDREVSDATKSERESSPASVLSAGTGPVIPPLRPSSSEARKLSEGSNAVEEDVKMEDAG